MVRQIGLSPLDAGSTTSLVRSRFPDVHAERVFAESGGNPMFAMEIAGALEAGGGPTSSLDAVLHERLDRLDGAARSLLIWAATFGRSFLLEHLMQVAEIGPGDFMNAIDELERRGFIRPLTNDNAATDYDFAHDLVRRAAYQAVSVPRRRLMHLAIARVLAHLPEAHAALAGDIAHHAALGDDRGLAAEFCLAAAERCLGLCAARDALELAERGLRHTPHIGATERIRIEVNLLSIAILADVSKAKSHLFEPSLRNVIPQAHAARLNAEAARGLMALAVLCFDQGKFDEAQREALRVSAAARLVAPGRSIQALAHAAQCLAILERDIEKAEALVAETELLAAEHQVEVLELLMAQGVILQYRGEHDCGLERLRQAMNMAKAQGVFWLGAICLIRLAAGELAYGNAEQALDHCATLRDFVGRLGEVSEGMFGNVIEAIARRRLGFSVDPLEIEQALTNLIRMDANFYLSEAYCLVGQSDLERGDACSARRHAELALAAAQIAERPTTVIWARALLMRAALELGETEAAREQIALVAPLLENKTQLSAHARQQALVAARDPRFRAEVT